MAQPEIALSLTTYQKPSHLRRVLASIAAQRDVPGGFELVVTDDGSTDETPDIVEQFRNRVPFPVSFTTHPHKGFHPARSRNEGAAASSAPYLLFLDGDCVLPPDHVAMHLARRAPGFAMVGDCYRLNPEESERLTEERIRRGELTVLYADEERRRLAKQDFKFRLYNFLRHPTKPSKLKSGNVGIWREDYLRVNGFDENYCGWGCEDDDLGRRLRRSGVGLASILRWTRSLHLWHPQTETPSEWRQGRNVKYHLRKGWLTRCRNGLVKRKFEDMALESSAKRNSRSLPPGCSAATWTRREPRSAPRWKYCSCPGKAAFPAGPI